MKTNQFNFTRLGLMFQRYFMERFHSELIYWGIMVIVFMFIRNSVAAMIPLIFIAGLFYASRFFREIHSRNNGVAYFMIPATQLEKLTVAVVMTSFYYFVMMMIAYVIGNVLGTFFNNMLANVNLVVLNIFHYSSVQWSLFTNTVVKFTNGQSTIDFLAVLAMFRNFLIFQSIFLCGSIYFKNSQAFKTIFVIIAVILLLSFMSAIELQLLFGGANDINKGTLPVHLTSADWWNSVGKYALKVFFYLLIPFFWLVSYFRLTEKQI